MGNLRGQLALYLVEGRLRGRRFLLVGGGERLGLGCLGLRLRGVGLLLCLLRNELGLGAFQATLVSLEVADDLVGVLVAGHALAGRLGEVRREAGLRRAVDVRLDRIVGDEVLVDLDRRLRAHELRGEGLLLALIVLQGLDGGVVLVVEDGGLLFLLGQASTRSAQPVTPSS